jgi:hypothetical protein
MKTDVAIVHLDPGDMAMIRRSQSALFTALLFLTGGCGSASGHPGEGPVRDAAAASGDGAVAGPGSGQDAEAADGTIPWVDAGTGDGDGATQGGDGGIGADGGRAFPDTYASIALLVDQLPQMNAAQMMFATSHYVGTEKQVLPSSSFITIWPCGNRRPRRNSSSTG